MTIEPPQLFEHTLSFPEHIWLGFFQEFFQQEYLFVGEEGIPISNRFRYDPGQPESNRDFDISLAFDFRGSRQNQLPQLVIEDTGVSMAGIAVNQLRNWSVYPNTKKERADLLRSTYIFHCLSKDRGESRMMASVVLDSIIAFKDQLYENGLNKVEPMSVGATQAMRSDSGEDFVNTPVQVTFEYLQVWRTVETPAAFFNRFCLVVEPSRVQALFRASMEVADAQAGFLLRASADVTDPNESYLIRASADLQDPLIEENLLRASAEVEDPVSETSLFRASMRVA